MLAAIKRQPGSPTRARRCWRWWRKRWPYAGHRGPVVIEVVLPWPPRGLSPNARQHWAALAKAKKAFRSRCALEARLQGVPRIANGAQAHALIALTFRPPDRRARDLDNVLASLKSGLDGLVDVLGVDDARWALSIQWGAPVKGGAVRVGVEVMGC